jgi:hypothetical protein
MDAAERRAWCRNLWVNACNDRTDVCAFFAVGTPFVSSPLAIDDTVAFPCSDTYVGLPQKTMAMLNYALANFEFDYFFKADDDTYVQVDRLTHYVRKGMHYVGHPIGSVGPRAEQYAHGGSGYLLSREAVEYLAPRMKGRDSGEEDKIVGEILFCGGYGMQHERKLVPSYAPDRIPTPRNEFITLHRVRTKSQAVQVGNYVKLFSY